MWLITAVGCGSVFSEEHAVPAGRGWCTPAAATGRNAMQQCMSGAALKQDIYAMRWAHGQLGPNRAHTHLVPLRWSGRWLHPHLVPPRWSGRWLRVHNRAAGRQGFL